MLVEADICPLCLDVFQGSKELLKHVFQTHHVSMQAPCQICLEHCQHQNEAVINKDTNENVRIKTEPLELNESQNEQQSEICDTKENVKIEPNEINGNIEDTETLSSSDIVKDLISDMISQMFKKPKVIIKPSILKINKNYQLINEKKFKCRKCNQDMDSKVDLMNHIYNTHILKVQENPDRYACLVCCFMGESFGADKLQRHVNEFYQESQNVFYQCNDCDITSMSRRIVQEHKCPGKPSVTSKSVTLDVTPTAIPKVDWTGFLSQDKSSSVTSLTPPRETVTNQNETVKLECWKCDTCDKNFLIKELFENHQCECQEIHQCDLCPMFFNSKKGLKKHKKGGHKCELCSRTFYSPKRKLKHMSNNHNFECHNCHQIFPLKQDLKTHACHQCDLCPMLFNSKAGLQKHKQDGHKCEFCPTIFKSVEGRYNHMLQHNFECHNCGLIFPLRQDLKYHECLSSVTPTIKSILTVKKPRKRSPRKHVTNHKHELYCDKCKQRFPSAVKLQEHKKSQHPHEYVATLKSQENAIIRCEFCDEKFTSKINLKHHMEIVHSKEKDVGQNSKKRKPENSGKDPDDDKSMKKVKFDV